MSDFKGAIMLIDIGKLARYICASTLFTACFFGQTVSSSLQGTVVDPTGAVVANAAVKVTNSDTGNSRMASTESSGLFRILDLEPGTYSLTVASSGFKGYQQTNIVLSANET